MNRHNINALGRCFFVAMFPLLFFIAISWSIIKGTISEWRILAAGFCLLFGCFLSYCVYLWIRNLQGKSSGFEKDQLLSLKEKTKEITDFIEFQSPMKFNKLDSASPIDCNEDSVKSLLMPSKEPKLPEVIYIPDAMKWITIEEYKKKYPSASNKEILFGNVKIYATIGEFLDQNTSIFNQSNVASISIWGDHRGTHYDFEGNVACITKGESNEYFFNFDNGVIITVYDPWFAEEWLTSFRIVEASRILCCIPREGLDRELLFDYRFSEKIRVSKTDMGYQMKGFEFDNSTFALIVDLIPKQSPIAKFV